MATENPITGVQAKIEGNVLVLKIPMQPPAPSSNGKTLVVASCDGL